MLSRFVAAVVLLLALGAPAAAADKDYLRRGERERTAYDRAVKQVLSRAWRSHVVLRVVGIPPFKREWAIGLSRSATGYTAFVAIVAPPDSVWYALGFSESEQGRDRSAPRSIVIEKPIPEQTATRVAALWRRVLTDPRNYRHDPAIHMHSDTFTYYLAFAPGERVTAWVPGWGPKTEQLIDVAYAVAAYAEGIHTERKLIEAISEAERKLGI